MLPKVLTVQFDGLFKKAWEEDVAELDKDSMHHSNYVLIICADVCKFVISWEGADLGKTKGRSTESDSVKSETDANQADVLNTLDTGSSALDEIFSVEAEKLDKNSDGVGQQQKEAWAVSGGSERIADQFFELVPDMAIEFPFELDKFQKEHCTRAVYTAPIKTISNQKYRDFCGKFDVGLLTGDVSLRPEASCLIVTTEILRSMLYRGADIIRDVEWVIFDEVHYVNDVERGVVWEEVIIMLPRHINIILLSATVPNTIEFADWIGRTKQKKIHVPGLVVVIFGFSKNQCDKSADSITGTDLTSGSEKSEICVFCDKAFSRLKGSDCNLPQVVRVQGLLCRGIGVHHAGLLPIVKEVVEMLFCRGVIKVKAFICCTGFVSTETFAMGVNAPARTVVFDTLRKFDGKEFTPVFPGEYTQMAGRAGRRGLDKIGTVIVMCRDEIPEEKVLKLVITGTPMKLESQFRLTYTMILHLLRVEELKVEDMLKRSFAEFHAQKKLPEQQQLLMRWAGFLADPSIIPPPDTQLNSDLGSLVIGVVSFSSISVCIALFKFGIYPHLNGYNLLVDVLKAQDHLLGVVLKSSSSNNKQYIVLLLKPDVPTMTQTPSDRSNLQDKKGSGIINITHPRRDVAAGVSFEVREADNTEFLCICNSKIKLDIPGLLEYGSNTAFSYTDQQLLKLKSNENKYPPALDPLKDLKLKDPYLVKTYHKWTNQLQKMSKNKCHECIKLEEHIMLAREIKKHKEEVNALEFELSNEALQQMPEFQGRIDVLKEIGCIDEDLVVQIKGQTKVYLPILLFIYVKFLLHRLFCFDILISMLLLLCDTAIRLGNLQAEFKKPVTPEEYAQENLKFGLVEVGTPFADICQLTDVPEGLIVRTIVRLDEICEFKTAAAIMGNSSLYKKMGIASNVVKRDIVFAASLYITGV
ncbi:ATP-dependent RNA helicase SKI2 [Hibiscus syriacus]|uniref:ATP-dependent RNA helicase SKI2 n=1 Tax=Hibiscus syriacus TaxID=106335 RepID=A0A6A2ZJ79_HIBSY|nr:ATP-dependent RNA helicase SKI2 [Hibiscus syriacus]